MRQRLVKSNRIWDGGSGGGVEVVEWREEWGRGYCKEWRENKLQGYMGLPSWMVVGEVIRSQKGWVGGGRIGSECGGGVARFWRGYMGLPSWMVVGEVIRSQKGWVGGGRSGSECGGGVAGFWRPIKIHGIATLDGGGGRDKKPKGVGWWWQEGGRMWGQVLQVVGGKLGRDDVQY
nr:hypothetical protein [Tanacetum cinerariifolium]